MLACAFAIVMLGAVASIAVTFVLALRPQSPIPPGTPLVDTILLVSIAIAFTALAYFYRFTNRMLRQIERHIRNSSSPSQNP